MASQPLSVVAERIQPHSKKTVEVEDEILRRVADGQSLWRIYRSDPVKFPHPVVFGRWAADDEQLALAHAVVREHVADLHASDAMDILDAEPPKVLSYDKEGNTSTLRIDAAGVALMKHRSDLRMKRAAQINPAVYGDKTLHAGHDGKEIKTEVAVSIRETMARLREAKRLGADASSAIVEARQPEPSSKALLADEPAAKPLEPGDPGMEFV